jgi:hypothetical protein
MLEVKLMQRPDQSQFIEVRLGSLTRAGLFAVTHVSDMGTAQRTEQAIFAAGGALAEHLEGAYGDNFDVSEVAREAREMWRQIQHDLSKRH